MFLVIGIASVWLFSCLLAVALCVAARRADEMTVLVLAVDEQPPQSVDFVAGFAEAPVLVARPAVHRHSSV